MLARCYRVMEGFSFCSLYQVRPVPNKERNEFAVMDDGGNANCMTEEVFNRHFRHIPIKEKRGTVCQGRKAPIQN